MNSAVIVWLFSGYCAVIVRCGWGGCGYGEFIETDLNYLLDACCKIVRCMLQNMDFFSFYKKNINKVCIIHKKVVTLRDNFTRCSARIRVGSMCDYQ